ncbi:MAG: DUF2911 domain-containing protein [Acidobacteria bacterium]|nr:DUF2911 domain-containing protein [Acidobacteriaceae bacterium]MBV9608598.1 DUF2911 domain-containing protein [Acidobacteriota bacterium]
MRKTALVCGLVLLASLLVVAQQDKSKRPSPPGSASCRFADGKQVNIDYSRPSTKGRQIYGGLVPWDKVWRTGANEATTFVTDTNLNVGGTQVPAGAYTLYTVPSQTNWKLVISKKTGQWGIPYPENEDLARIDMKSEPLPSQVEEFTINFVQHGGSACTLNLDWERTRASVAVSEQK